MRASSLRRTSMILGIGLLAALGPGCSDSTGPESTLKGAPPVAVASIEVRTMDAPLPDPSYDASCQTGAIVRLKATGSFDPAGKPIAFEWRDTVDGALAPDFIPRPNPMKTSEVEVGTNLFTMGEHQITLTVTATDGRKGRATLRVFVVPCNCGG